MDDVEAVVSIAAGLTAGSLVVLAFGLDSLIELASAGVLMWRLSVELRHGQKISERAEHIASRVGGLLFALAIYVTTAPLWRLWTGASEDFSWPGLIVALIAIPTMRYLAHRKIAIAEKTGSPALRADAMEAVTCGWLSFVVVISLAAHWLTGAWWIDGVGSLAIVWFFDQRGARSMVWQRLLLLLIAVLLLLSKGAQAEEKEPTAIIELGGAGEWGLPGASSFGPSAAVEFIPHQGLA